MITKYVPAVFLAAMLVIIVAVGGSASAQNAGDVVNVQKLGANATVQTCDDKTIELNRDEKQMLDLHKQTRTDKGLPPLCMNTTLTEAARVHSQEMLNKSYLSHDSFNGQNLETRLAHFGYTFSGYSSWKYGENISWGPSYMGEPENRFDTWMNSDDHKGNILNKDYREIGIGSRTGIYENNSGKMYTVDFGTRQL
jgi:uncharacterized protein YkwD